MKKFKFNIDEKFYLQHKFAEALRDRERFEEFIDNIQKAYKCSLSSLLRMISTTPEEIENYYFTELPF